MNEGILLSIMMNIYNDADYGEYDNETNADIRKKIV